MYEFAIWSAKHLGAGRVIAVDSVPDRLEAARARYRHAVNQHSVRIFGHSGTSVFARFSRCGSDICRTH